MKRSFFVFFCMGFLQFFGCSKPKQDPPATTPIKQIDMKKIVYRGGIVSFSIPSNWIEEYDPEGGGTFYEAGPDTGTLRLNVLGFQAPPTEPAEQMVRKVFKDDAVEKLPSGFMMRYCVKPGMEEGQALELHRWEIAVPVPPNNLRLVIFTHTILAGQQSDPKIAREVEILNTSIRSAVFSQEPGITPE